MAKPELPPAELDVLQCLWEAEELTAREVRELLAKRRPLSHSSVCTLLDRLSAKGFVTRQKGLSGKAFVYRANVASNKTLSGMIDDLVERAFGGSGVDLIASLLETKRLTNSEIGQLQCLLDDLKARQSSAPREKSSKQSASTNANKPQKRKGRQS